MRKFWIAGIGIACLATSFALGGLAPVGRLFLGAGLPSMAVPFFSTPDWKGVAQYRAGRYAEAAKSFALADQMFNMGNAQVQQGKYAAALEAYDIARLSGDGDAAANFDLVAAYYAGLALDPDTPIAWFTEKDGDGQIVKSSIAQGSARAAGAGDESTNTGALLGLPELATHGRVPVRKVFDDKFMVANDRWLVTLADVPGEFLAARIKHEQKRRGKLGLAQPVPEDPE